MVKWAKQYSEFYEADEDLLGSVAPTKKDSLGKLAEMLVGSLTTIINERESEIPKFRNLKRKYYKVLQCADTFEFDDDTKTFFNLSREAEVTADVQFIENGLKQDTDFKAFVKELLPFTQGVLEQFREKIQGTEGGGSDYR